MAQQARSRSVYSYSGGPGTLPKEIFRQAAAELEDYKGTGLSVMEMSHRSKHFAEIAEHTRALIKELLNVPDNFTIFMFQGGASL